MRGERVPAGGHVMRAALVVVAVVGDGADQGVALGDAGAPRQVLANLDPGNVRWDWPKFAADLGRRVGLQVPHVDGGGPAAQPYEDAARPLPAPAAARGSRRLEAQQIGERKSEWSQGTGAQEL